MGQPLRTQRHSWPFTHMVLDHTQSMWREIRDIFSAPFQAKYLSLPTYNLDEIEQRRRVVLLRFIALSLASIFLFLPFLMVFINQTPSYLRLSDLALLVVSLGCLALSYSRMTILATILFILASLIICLGIVLFEEGSLDERSALIYSFISLLIIMAGLLLPQRIAWLTVLLILVPTLLSLMLLPVSITHPRFLAIGLLLILYLSILLITWVHAHYIDASMHALVEAYQQERERSAKKDAFIDIASHELRTPLTTLLLDCKLLERSTRHPEQQEKSASLVADMTTHLGRMDAMIGMMLDASRISLDEFSMKKEPDDVAAVLRKAVEEQQQQSGRIITMVGLDHPMQAKIDPRRMWEVMSNLVGNAVKYSPKSTLVEVTATTVPYGFSQALRVAVHDEGAGIPEQAMPHLFERHFRVQGDGHQEGLGLGLYISSTIIQQHGGRIWAESTIDQGSTFTFEIPLLSA